MKTILTKEELSKFKNYLYNPNNGFSFKVGYFDIPMKVGNSSLLDHQVKLLSTRSMGVKNFVSWLKDEFNHVRSNYSIIEQFPIPIEDRDFWKECCIKNGCIEYSKRQYFVLDILIPDIGMVLEVDYKITHDPKYDSARDDYLLFKHCLITRRYLNYNQNDHRDFQIRIEVLKDIDQNYSRFYNQLNLDFTESILGYFERTYENDIDLLKRRLNKKSRYIRDTRNFSEEFLEVMKKIGINFPSSPYI